MKVCIDPLNSLSDSASFERFGEPTGPNTNMRSNSSNPNDPPKNSLENKNPLLINERLRESQILPKKEQALLKKQYQKLNMFFGGMKTMKNRPNLIILVGQDSEMNAVRECKKLQENSEVSSFPLRTVTFLDTNCDPELTDLFIPANDDSTKSIDLILNQLADALIE
jgi:small subunit ribosomal protein S2